MSRPKIKVKLYLQNLINVGFELFFINEISDKVIKTKYERFLNIKNKNEYYRDFYRFKTNNNYYDIEFYMDILSKDRVGFIDIENEYVDTIILNFINNEVNNNIYINEQYKVLGKISYLINEYLKNNPKISIFRILKNTHKNNLSTYNHIFKKQFENNFTMFETTDEFFYVKK
jgi:hypothetical protein